MLKDIFAAALENIGQVLNWMLPYYPLYLIAAFLALTAYLLFATVKSGTKGLARVPARYLIINSTFLACLFLLMCLRHGSFIIFTDERMYLQQAAEYLRTGQTGLLVSDSIMPFFYALTLKVGGLTALKGVVFLLLSLHFLLWKLILEDVLKVGALLSASAVFICAFFCLSCFPNIVSYMSFGYFLSSSAAYLALKYSGRDDGGKAYNLLPFIALLGLVFRQECVVLFPFIFICLLLSGALKKSVLPLVLASILALPMLFSLWRDELGMNAEPFDRNLVAACYASGRSAQDCVNPGISANKSYMLNILAQLSRLDTVKGDRLLALAQETYEAPNPSLINIYYNLRYRERWLGVLTGLALISMISGLVYLKSRRRQLLPLACLTALYFLIFYLQKYSVGDFERFYFYLFPLYLGFITPLLDFGIKKYAAPSFSGAEIRNK